MAISSGYDLAMLSFNISSLKNQLSAILNKVKKGEEVLVLDRDRPIAKITAVSSADYPAHDRALLEELEHQGIIKRAKGKLPDRHWLETHLTKLPRGVSALQVLLEERREESR